MVHLQDAPSPGCLLRWWRHCENALLAGGRIVDEGNTNGIWGVTGQRQGFRPLQAEDEANTAAEQQNGPGDGSTIGQEEPEKMTEPEQPNDRDTANNRWADILQWVTDFTGAAASAAEKRRAADLRQALAEA